MKRILLSLTTTALSTALLSGSVPASGAASPEFKKLVILIVPTPPPVLCRCDAVAADPFCTAPPEDVLQVICGQTTCIEIDNVSALTFRDGFCNDATSNCEDITQKCKGSFTLDIEFLDDCCCSGNSTLKASYNGGSFDLEVDESKTGVTVFYEASCGETGLDCINIAFHAQCCCPSQTAEEAAQVRVTKVFSCKGCREDT